MEQRIICDTYCKDKAPMFGKDPSDSFNQRIAAVNNMYGWLYKQGILKKISFEWRDYSDITFFALDVDSLKSYRKAMENSGVPNAMLALHHIFDEEYTPCLYSGAIELTWTMLTYRDFEGTVERSWECFIVRDLNSVAAIDIQLCREKEGTRAALKLAFELTGFYPSDLPEEQ
jgi:hypothetical protein